MHYLYILYSNSIDRYYIGESRDVDERLVQHNDGIFKGSYTKQATDWIFKLILECKDISHARRVEAYLKRKKSRKYIIYFIANADVQQAVLNELS